MSCQVFHILAFLFHLKKVMRGSTNIHKKPRWHQNDHMHHDIIMQIRTDASLLSPLIYVVMDAWLLFPYPPTPLLNAMFGFHNNISPPFFLCKVALFFPSWPQYFMVSLACPCCLWLGAFLWYLSVHVKNLWVHWGTAPVRLSTPP